MRVRSFPFTTTFITFIVVCWFPLLEFDINWNYKDWDQTISNRTGTVILDETKKLNFQRVPGINPGWKRAKSVVEKMLNSVNDAKLPEYQYEWKYVSMNRERAGIPCQREHWRLRSQAVPSITEFDRPSQRHLFDLQYGQCVWK